MNRRGFLGAILAAGAAPAVVKASSLMPIYVPKLWTPGPYDVVVEIAPGRGNYLITIDQITKEALRILNEQTAFMNVIGRQYKRGGAGDRLTIRVPEIYRGQ